MRRIQSTRPRVATRYVRRGAAAAVVAVSMTVLMGFTALVVDVGMLYNVKTQMQTAADAAALAAATELGSFSGGYEATLTAAREVARQYAEDYNTVGNGGLTLDVEQDVLFKKAYIDGNNKYVIQDLEAGDYPNVVEVTCRRTAESGSGAVSLWFAQVLGFKTADVVTKATAVLTPRDIVFVLDLSRSHNDDSSLRSMHNTNLSEVPIKDVYDGLLDPDAALAAKTDSIGFTSEVQLISNGNGTTTISVSLTSDSQSSTPALSHVVFGMSEAAQTEAAASYATSGSYSSPDTGVDPTTGVSGLKFDSTGDGLGEDGAVQTHEFSFTLSDENLASLTVATKAGKMKDTSISYNLVPELTVGNLQDWGTETVNDDWSFASDSGLVQIKKNAASSLSTSWVSQASVDRGYAAYTTAQMNVINNTTKSSETTTGYRNRVKVALGISRWTPSSSTDKTIDSSELTTMIAYPSSSTNPDTCCKKMGGSWDSWIDYVRSSGSSMCTYDPDTQYYGDSDLQYRYGLKTFVDYLQENCTSSYEGFSSVAVQPMQAVVDAVTASLEIIQQLQSNDRVGLASYATEGYGPNEKSLMSWVTEDISTVGDKINELYPGIFSNNTNIAQGIDKGKEVLTAWNQNARRSAAHVMILLTDGIANMTRDGDSGESQAKADAITAAEEAHAAGIQIYTISVGASADQELMTTIAEKGGGETAHAGGDISEYRDKLEEIFKKLGGKRPVVLIE